MSLAQAMPLLYRILKVVWNFQSEGSLTQNRVRSQVKILHLASSAETPN